MSAKVRAKIDDLDLLWRDGRAHFIGPVGPPMILWQMAGEPGFPFHWPGGPLPGTINYQAAPPAVVSEQFAFDFGASLLGAA